jgi:multisubunit Na+/H+ antiporter MnhG subunit
MMIYLAWGISGLAVFLLVTSAIAFAKARDVFTMAHIVMIANCYIIPLLLIGIELEKFSWLSFAKISALILLNLVVVNLLCHAVIRRAILNKVDPKAEVRRS